MLTKSDFTALIASSVANYPAVETYYKAKDPRILQNLEAMAMMLALYSAQLEVAQAEPFDKTKDSTVLADAAMRGIIPKSTPVTLSITVTNSGSVDITISKGRVLLDSSGRYLLVSTSVTVSAGGTGTLTAQQLYASSTTHTVTESKPFYEIQIDLANDDSYLCGLSLADDDGNSYEYRERYVNTSAGEYVFHLEVDEQQRYYIRLGYTDVVGVQPNVGDIFTITAYYSYGNVDYSNGDKINFETTTTVNDAYISMEVAEVTTAGVDPITTTLMRELAKYPSIYNENAVYLGEFDFLVRRNYTDIQFLSVWNEAAEETARGSSVDNINCLFVAVMGSAGDETTQAYSDHSTPTKITSLTTLQQNIKQTILNADDSYSIVFYTPVVRAIAMKITATVATSYDADTVASQISSVVLSNYGLSSDVTKRGRVSIRYQEVYTLLKSNVTALTVGNADIQISIEDLSDYLAYPELWQYVTADSLAVNVTTSNVATNQWGSGI